MKSWLDLTYFNRTAVSKLDPSTILNCAILNRFKAFIEWACSVENKSFYHIAYFDACLDKSKKFSRLHLVSRLCSFLKITILQSETVTDLAYTSSISRASLEPFFRIR